MSGLIRWPPSRGRTRALRLGLAVGALVLVSVTAAAAYIYLGSSPSNPGTPPTYPSAPPSPPAPPASSSCKGTASCFSDSVTNIVDGDTLDVGSTRIRLALVNTPEVGQPGYTEASDATARTCPVGSTALVDEDDGQTGGSYGRMIAVVYCGGVNLNAALLDAGLAVLEPYYCSVSEFASEPWTGC